MKTKSRVAVITNQKTKPIMFKLFHLYLKEKNQNFFYTSLTQLFKNQAYHDMNVAKITISRRGLETPYENDKCVIRLESVLVTVLRPVR